MNFLYSHWLDLPLATRHKIAAAFGIKKLRSTHVVNDYVQDDGFDIKEIELTLNVENMQKYLETSQMDITVLWGQLVDKIEGREIPKEEVKKDPANSTLTYVDGEGKEQVYKSTMGAVKPKKDAKTKAKK